MWPCHLCSARLSTKEGFVMHMQTAHQWDRRPALAATHFPYRVCAGCQGRHDASG